MEGSQVPYGLEGATGEIKYPGQTNISNGQTGLIGRREGATSRGCVPENQCTWSSRLGVEHKADKSTF